MLSTLAACNLVCDAMYAFDALIFGYAWWADVTAAHEAELEVSPDVPSDDAMSGDTSGNEFAPLLIN
jgi:hypothetical protein